VFEKHKSASPKAIPIIFTHKLFRRADLFLIFDLSFSFLTFYF